MQTKILIVEDEKAIVDLLEMALSAQGYLCVHEMHGEAALKRIDEESFDMILLDVMLPEISGFEIMEYIAPRKIPVIFITAKSDIADRIHGLQLGADDYLIKPFDMMELLARVQAVLRRYHGFNNQLSYRDIVMNLNAHTVTKGGQEVYLTIKEFELLKLFLNNRNLIMYREVLFQHVWHQDLSYESRTLDLHIQKLRRKLDLTDAIRTVYKIGYKLVD